MTLRYAITGGLHAAESGAGRRSALISQAERLAARGVDYIQLRELDLGATEVIGLARGMFSAIRKSGSAMQLLVHGRADIALAIDADGVHLRSGREELTPGQVRQVYAAGAGRSPVVSVSCHTISDVERARDEGANLILFAPVFGKMVEGEMVVPGTGLQTLAAACIAAGKVPVLALGGVTKANAAQCLAAGAAGIAGIRLFR